MFGTRTFQRPDRPGASTSMARRTAFHRCAMSWAILDGALAVSRQEWAQVAHVPFLGSCLPLQRLL